MNTGFYSSLDTNFNEALEMSEKTFEHSELINLLKIGNIPQKQIAALRLERINDQHEADILISNLTGCDGKIREAVALCINRLLVENPTYINYFTQAEIFANASIDINGNICRLVIDSVSILKQNPEFSKVYIDKIITFINEAYQKLDSFIFRDKKYVINKQLFKLYWALESLRLFIFDIDFDVLYSIIERASGEREYTIREKAAQIIKISRNDKFVELKNILANDNNYYVRNAIN